MVAYKKNNENYQKIYDQLIKRTKFCKEKVAENKILVQKNQVIIIIIYIHISILLLSIIFYFFFFFKKKKL